MLGKNKGEDNGPQKRSGELREEPDLSNPKSAGHSTAHSRTHDQDTSHGLWTKLMTRTAGIFLPFFFLTCSHFLEANYLHDTSNKPSYCVFYTFFLKAQAFGGNK